MVDKLNGQDPGNDPELSQGNGNNGQPGNGGDGGAPQTIKVGDKEYTPEQLVEFEKKALQYDELLPEFTRKSQRLAELEKGPTGDQKQKEDEPPYYKDDWVPKTYKELADAIKMAEDRGHKKALEVLQQMEVQRDTAKKQVDNFVEETKKQDKAFDEDDFFGYIAKHGLKVNSVEDLKAIYSAYQEKGGTPAEPGQKQRKDSVSGPGAGKGTPYTAPMQEIRKSGSAYDAVMDAYKNLKK